MELTQLLSTRIAPAVILFGLAVFVHEAGHFLMAKRKKVGVEKFSLGFGPKIAGFTRGGTEYLLSLIPLGGYVKMAGDDPSSSEGKTDEFFSKTPAARMKIVFAGPAMNILLAYVLTVTVLWAVGIRLPKYDSVIGRPPAELAERGLAAGDRIVGIDGNAVSDWEGFASYAAGRPPRAQADIVVERGGEKLFFRQVEISRLLELAPYIPAILGNVMVATPAYAEGLKTGDRIAAIDGTEIRDWPQMQAIISGSAGEEIQIRVARADREFTVRITPVDMLGDGLGIIGISAESPGYYKKSFGWKSIHYAFITNINQIALSYRMLGMIIARPGKYKDFVGGPVMVMQMAGAEAEKGISDFLSFMAAINIMLAIINLVPFPVLDGGHILFFLIEIIKGSPVSFKKQEAIQKVGIVLLVLLMVYLLAQDSLRQVDRARTMRARDQVEEQ